MTVNYLRLRNQAASLRTALEETGRRSDAIVAGHLHMLEILAFAHNWTQNASARDQQGRPTSSSDPSAVAWDLLAAANIAGGYNASTLLKPLREHLRREPQQFNDDQATTHLDVLKALASVILSSTRLVTTEHDLRISEIQSLTSHPETPHPPLCAAARGKVD